MSYRLTNPRIISTLGACSMLIVGLGFPAAGATTLPQPPNHQAHQHPAAPPPVAEMDPPAPRTSAPTVP